ncbi:MAG: hypothetical protein ACKVOH_03940 [Chlamydiales bacterium]
MKKFVLFTLLLCGCSFGPEKKEKSNKEAFLFILHSANGEVVTDRYNKNNATLTLINIDQSVVYFSDRPERHAGTMKLTSFLKIWNTGKGNFHEDPPNAGFVSFEDAYHRFSELPIELKNPKYDDLHDVVIFDISSLGKPFEFDQHMLEEVSVFIDYFYDCEEKEKKCFN